MCMQRDKDDPGDIVFPYPIFELIDLTEATEDDVVNLNELQNDQWNPYNLLPSSDEDEPADTNNDNDDPNTESNSTDEPSNEINNQRQRIIVPVTTSNLNFENNDIQDFSRFELNIPQILLSMSRVTHVLELGNPPPRD